ncbi:receptor-like protein EIX1 [Bidens hawaiensis]|uniref:receptor-like protein EIX1 n=1 Tax=Bidens hawaiensis TaxID=980011 RepID=UPI00404A3F38
MILRQALLRFKHGLIDSSNRLSSWVEEDRECCTWAGIECDNSTGHVHQIHLRGPYGLCAGDYNTFEEYEKDSEQTLTGDISPSLLDLKQLRHLDLSCNDFGGIQVPNFIGSLENMRYLNLLNSKFSGIIPSQMGNLSKLHVLCLGNFRYASESTSMINMQWLSNLRVLHHLDMSGMDLSKATDWHHVMNTLPSLVELYFSACELSNIYPYVPSVNLTSLSLLDLSFNNFTSSVPGWMFSIPGLVSLDLGGCHFHGIIPSNIYSFHNLTSLELLRVSGNEFMNSSSILKDLSSSNLALLDISHCGVSSSVLDSLHNLTSLLSLDLDRNQLTRGIPESLCNLCNVREIDFSLNSFRNISLAYLLEIFFECESHALESLSLYENYIVGIIPHSIRKLYSLRSLDLSLNQISGPITNSIGQLSLLEGLFLSNNQLNGSFPYWIGRLSLLKTLDLSHNQLEGSLPNSIGQLSKLIDLDFSYNFLTGVVTESHFAKLASLNYLDGSHNSLTLKLLDANWIPPFKLQRLYISSWVLGPQFPLWLQRQKDLMFLDISNTSIFSPMPESFVRSFPSLYYLDMSLNQIQGSLTLLDIPTTLEVINLSSNEFWGLLHHLLCSNGVTGMMVLNLGNNHLSGAIPECWEKWLSLVVLNLENNDLSGEIPRTLGSVPSSLNLLNMHRNKISGILPPSLMNLTYLEILQLGGNELRGSIPAWIGTKLTFLRILNLRSNNFDGNVPHELCYLSHVHILDLAHNNLSGNIPRCFSNFNVLSGIETNSLLQFSFSFGYGSFIVDDSLVTKGREDTYSIILGLVRLLDLSSNKFYGDIPSELTTLQKLQFLNLSRNQLTGYIPQNIGDMKALESLDLSLNKLSGELPMSLARLISLSSFNVSYNNLIGRIPTSTQIQSFNESSFFGNKLCGAPLANGCVSVEGLTNTTQEHKEDNEKDWVLIISIVVGFVTGFWIIVGPMIAIRSWRIAYFRLWDKLRFRAECLFVDDMDTGIKTCDTFSFYYRDSVSALSLSRMSLTI